MALYLLALAFAMAMVMASAEMGQARSGSLKGSVLCSNCGQSYDFSGIVVLVECGPKKKSTVATAGKNGSFEAELPANTSSPANCRASIIGGPNQLYTSKKDIVSEIIKASPEANTYTTKTKLKFSTSCSSVRKMGKCLGDQLGSSKTIDLPIPKDYGLPPTSYYIPTLPIIGIP